ncbi:hypothetical protein D7003_09465 [Arthrobacter oryzae]|uniref:Uncharacterized protein n=1 Tax=Arthrobacter oryzae TaxID=409290 RepID=A0A3N0C0S9_9MICC|nr:hypothetical protein D7003_09465 [Arthrobacter oryzae]
MAGQLRRRTAGFPSSISIQRMNGPQRHGGPALAGAGPVPAPGHAAPEAAAACVTAADQVRLIGSE